MLVRIQVLTNPDFYVGRKLTLFSDKFLYTVYERYCRTPLLFIVIQWRLCRALFRNLNNQLVLPAVIIILRCKKIHSRQYIACCLMNDNFKIYERIGYQVIMPILHLQQLVLLLSISSLEPIEWAMNPPRGESAPVSRLVGVSGRTSPLPVNCRKRRPALPSVGEIWKQSEKK